MQLCPYLNVDSLDSALTLKSLLNINITARREAAWWKRERRKEPFILIPVTLWKSCRKNKKVNFLYTVYNIYHPYHETLTVKDN